MLILLAIVAFSGVLWNGFVYDDLLIIYGNPFFTTQPDWAALLSRDYFTISRQGSYRPMVTLTYMIDGTIWAGRPSGFHLTNLLLHVANVLLLFELARRLGATTRAACAAAALFAVHPAFTEVVAFPNYREDLLVLLFSLASVGLWDRGTVGPWDRGTVGRKRMLFSLLSALLYFFALLSKESGLGLLIFLLFILWRRRSDPRSHGPMVPWSHGPTIPFLLVTFVYLILRFVVYGASNELSPSYLGDSFFVNAFTMCRVMASYVPLVLFPVHLRADYVVTPVSSPAGAMVALLGMVMLLSAGAWVLLKRQGWAGLSLGWALAFLLPVMNLYPIAHPKAERYLYLPCAGLFLLVGIMADQLLMRAHSGRRRQVLLGGAGLIILSFTALARMRVAECGNSFRLWKTALLCEPDSDLAHSNLGVEYLERDRVGDALRQFRQALELRPSPLAEMNLARAKIQQSLHGGSADPEAVEDAIRVYRQVISETPPSNRERPFLHHSLAITQRKARRLEEALTEHQKAESLAAHSDEIYLHHGISLQMVGELEAAIGRYRKALSLFPSRAQTHYNLGTALEAKKRLEEARSAYKSALRLDPDYVRARAGLATVLIRMGRFEDSLKHFEGALAAQPHRAGWRLNYAQALLRVGRTEEALRELKGISPEALPPSHRRALEHLLERISRPSSP